MFRKRVRKNFPPGTFIPTPARLAAIVQLCIAFTLLAWQGSLPFMGELFSTKYKLLVYQHLMGKKVEGHSERFSALPKREQTQILKEYAQLQSELDTTFLTKIKKTATGLWDLPLFEKAWILFAILIPILLLKRVEGASQIIWILPLLSLAYALDNRFQGQPSEKTAEERLFPSEDLILKKYVGEPLKPSIIEQQQQLQQGWQTYLVREWAKEEPSQDTQQFLQQAEVGDFAFNLARIKALKVTPSQRPKQEPLSLLALYLFWNISFCLIVTKTLRQERFV
ncbi:MAG: hypothetical protein LLG04_13510 [Parachlamydia sp.]|nr:hypothetical protein [Parachlamydia sp.]